MTVELLFNQSLSAAASANNNETVITNKKRQPLSALNSNLTPRDGKNNNKSTTTITKSKRKRSKKSSKKVRSREIYTPLIVNRQSNSTTQNNKQRSTVVNDTAAPQLPTIPIPDKQAVLPKLINNLPQELVAGKDSNNRSSNNQQYIKPTNDDITTIQLSDCNQSLQSNTTIILNFGYNANIVGKVRSLPLRVVAPSTLLSKHCHKEEGVISVQFINVPIQSGFDTLDDEYDDIQFMGGKVLSLKLKQNESKIIHVLWTPKQEGEVRERMVMYSPWSKVEISLIGIARSSIDSGESVSQEQTALEPSSAAQGEEKSKDTTAAVYQGRDNITYNAQQWEDEQCKTFMTWLNNIFHPLNTTTSVVNESQLIKEWQNANKLFNSNKMINIRSAIEREVKEGRLAITPRSNRNVLDEVYVQEQLTKLLLSYTPRWLQLGLGIVLALDDDQFVKVSLPMRKRRLSLSYFRTLFYTILTLFIPYVLTYTHSYTDEQSNDKRIIEENYTPTCTIGTIHG